MKLQENGCELLPAGIDEAALMELRNSVFVRGEAGKRCLLDEAVVRRVAATLRTRLIEYGYLSHEAVAIQAIAFDKTPETNWKVTWHQDVMFPFATLVATPGFDMPSLKDGIDYARPPREVLEVMLAVRLHLDDCGPANGPLRVSPNSHQYGIFRVAEIAGRVEQLGETACVAAVGDVLLMRPLLLHASSPATEPRHRRVLHLVYHSGQPMPEKWHRAVRD